MTATAPPAISPLPAAPRSVAPSAPEKSGRYLPTLDGWRALAIAGVMIAHGTAAVFGPTGSHPWAAAFRATRYGALGVDVFFGISGFLICTRLLEERARFGRVSLAGFYIRRAFRILPPYVAYLAIAAGLGLVGVLPVATREIAACVLFVRNYYLSAQSGGWYTAHFWSLAVEEHFYLLWPALLVFARRRALLVAAMLAIAVGLWRVAAFRVAPIPGVSFYERTDIRLDALMWGCWTAILVSEHRASLTRWLRPRVCALLALAFVVCVRWSPPLAMTWQALIVPLVLLGTVLHPRTFVGRMLDTAAMRWIGVLSYSLYLWQQLFLTPLDTRAPALGMLQRWPVNIVAVFAAASLSYYLVERPSMAVGRRLAARQANR
ncbi:MAG TPA: acyltransferase [Gemmatimonadaceae bacterium]|nr:acyltransferase [Gemmatimonadaceae bacterium]